MAFTDAETAYLQSQRLARFATVSTDGQPDVAPVGYEFDGSDFYIAGMDLTNTRKYRNVIAGKDRVALVVDDVASAEPWTPRFVRVYGSARAVQRDGHAGPGEYLQIAPSMSWSWNLDGAPFGEARPPRKAVHRSPVVDVRDGTLRPSLAAPSAAAPWAAAAEFAAGLQAGHDQRDADALNRQFAADVVWGSPFGALVTGYDELHPIHARFQREATGKPAFRYEVRHVLGLGDDVVVTHIARVALDANGEPRPLTDEPDWPFSELAMYVLVRRSGQWWLAAGQNTPMRAGGAVSAVR
jgi:pyridoxamine 5'-phosphate oxidase family protein